MRNNVKPPSKQTKENTDPSESISKQLRNQLKKLSNAKMPGKFTSKKQHATAARPAPSTSVTQNNNSFMAQMEKLILNFEYNHDVATQDIISSLQSALVSLIQKNQRLLSINRQLFCNNQLLQQKVDELEQQIHYLKSQVEGGAGQRINKNDNAAVTDIMAFFNPQNLIPIIEPYDGVQSNFVFQDEQQQVLDQINDQEGEMQSRQKITSRVYRCKIDGNSNIRAFYLSMLKTSHSRDALKALLDELQMDQNYKIIPLMPTNQFWVSVAHSYLQCLQQGLLMGIEELQNYINSTSIVDLIMISALRNRAEFKTEGLYDTEIQTSSIYRILANHFELEYQEIIQVACTTYRFQCGDYYSFDIVHSDENEYLIKLQDVFQGKDEQGGASQVQSEYRINQNNYDRLDDLEVRFNDDDDQQQEASVVNEFDTEEEPNNNNSSSGQLESMEASDVRRVGSVEGSLAQDKKHLHIDENCY